MSDGVTANVKHGSCLDILKQYPENYFASVVTDPPYGISFMGKKWDYDVPSVEVWKEVLRVLKPGGHILVACGTRTQHRMAVNIEDAGFEIRDIVSWLYGSGFPKSMDVSKAIDKSFGAKREVVGQIKTNTKMQGNNYAGEQEDKKGGVVDVTVAMTQEAKQWDGWGTALKPAQELFTLARKPLSEKTVAANVLKWGTGGINIDASRVPVDVNIDDKRLGGNGSWSSKKMAKNVYSGGYVGKQVGSSKGGRFPANVIHDGSGQVIIQFPHTKTGAMKKPYAYTNTGTSMGKPTGHTKQIHEANEGSAARFFYCAKASRKERGEGNNHPTVKPIKLMEYLIRLITPSNGIVLDCYAGSGSTGIACKKMGFDCVLIERELDYCNIIKERMR